MSDEPELILTPAVESQLDQSLQRWALQRRLTPLRAEAILQSLHTTSDELSDEWWRDFWGQLTRVIEDATRLPYPLLYT